MPAPTQDDPLTRLLAAVTVPDDVTEVLPGGEVDEHHLALARDAELRLRRLRLQIKARLAGARDGRCHCGAPLEGRTDRVYCSANCREAARRRRSRARRTPRDRAR